MRSLGLYIHIPFCKAKCIYCDFYSLPRAEGQMDAYVSALTAQLATWREHTADCTVDTVYFGGGTPSYLGPDRLCRLLDAVFQSYRVAPGAEITLETNPDSAQDISALRQLHNAGFDRLSLGMQSADDAELRRIGRVHTHAQTVRAVENARAAGFDNLSLDLIYGLPGQTMTRWQANLDAALALAPEHLSCYGLKVEEGTPLFARRERFTLPDDDAQADMYLSAVGLLARRGYEQYEISNFARPGYEGKHNLIYWDCGDYLGLGPAAHSCMGGKRFCYAPDTVAFLQDAAAPIMDGSCGAEDYLILQLRLRKGLDLDAYKALYGKQFSTAQLAFVQNCVRAGYATFDGRILALTPAGLIVQNSILAQLL